METTAIKKIKDSSSGKYFPIGTTTDYIVDQLTNKTVKEILKSFSDEIESLNMEINTLNNENILNLNNTIQNLYDYLNSKELINNLNEKIKISLKPLVQSYCTNYLKNKNNFFILLQQKIDKTVEDKIQEYSQQNPIDNIIVTKIQEYFQQHPPIATKDSKLGFQIKQNQSISTTYEEIDDI